MTDWKRVQGSQEQKPQEFDTTSSAVVVYQRKNIERVTVEDKVSGETTEIWQYDERELSREEYSIIIAEIQQAQIKEANDTDITILMAITDLYEAVTSK